MLSRTSSPAEHAVLAHETAQPRAACPKLHHPIGASNKVPTAEDRDHSADLSHDVQRLRYQRSQRRPHGSRGRGLSRPNLADCKALLRSTHLLVLFCISLVAILESRAPCARHAHDQQTRCRACQPMRLI